MSTPTPHDLHDFMAQVTDEMAAEYQRIYRNAVSDPGTAGDEGEENWASLLRDWLPAQYHVRTKGRLLSTNGTRSPQVDVVVLKPSYPPKLLDKKTWLADGVAAVFECKNTLTAAHVTAAVEKSALIKDLIRERSGSPRRELRSALVYGLLAHSHTWKGPSSTPVQNVESAAHQALAAVQHPRLEIDCICVADLACWSTTYISAYSAAWALGAAAHLTSVFGGGVGPKTALVGHSPDAQDQVCTFRPVATLLNKLSHALAWEDPSMRDIADYFRLANLSGHGSGGMRPWPLDAYSPETRQAVLAGRVTNEGPWNEWSLSGGF